MPEQIHETNGVSQTSRVLVTGGTGHLGREIVEVLKQARHRVRILARKPGADTEVEWAIGDLSNGAGLEEALKDVNYLIHAATNSPIARRGKLRLTDLFHSPDDVDLHGTVRLVKAANRAGVHHFLFTSIVGLEHSRLPYSRIKLAGEKVVTTSDLSWSVVRATPFFYLIAKMLSGMSRWPVWPLPTAPFQPVHPRDVADYVVRCLFDGKRGVRPEIGGPEVTSYAEMGAQLVEATMLEKRIWRLPFSPALARQAGIVVANGVRGATRWIDWLAVGRQP